MIAERLRKSILQAAIQGKLTEQLPEDGDARDMLAQIQAEKVRLIKEGKIKKENPLPAITEDEIPFDIPENWCWVRLEQITSILGDGIHGTPEYDVNSEYSFINGNNLNDGKIEIKGDTKHVSECEYLKYKKQLDETTVLVSINGTIGNIAFYNNEKVILGKSACYFNLLNGISKDYIKILLNSDYFLKYAVDNATGSTINNVSLKTMRGFLVPLPPKSVQDRVIQRIISIRPVLSNLSKDETKLDALQKSFPKKMKDSLLQSAIQGKLTEQLESDGDARDLVAEIQREKARLIKQKKIKAEKPLPEIAEDEVPFDIPDNWCWVRLGEMISLQTGATFRKDQAQYVKKGNIRVLRGGNIVNDGYDLLDNDIYLSPDLVKGDILLRQNDLITPSVTSLENIGKVAIIDKDLPDVACGGFVFLIRFIDEYQAISKYIYYCIQSNHTRTQMRKLTNKSGQAFYNIGGERLKSLIFPLPPIAEQKRIVERLEQLVPLCDTLE